MSVSYLYVLFYLLIYFFIYFMEVRANSLGGLSRHEKTRCDDDTSINHSRNASFNSIARGGLFIKS